MRRSAGSALPEPLIEQIYGRTGGVPLFVEEFTKLVQESAAFDQAPDFAMHGSFLPGGVMPATLQDLVMVRVDRMMSDRDVAQLAATLGSEFSYEQLAAVAPVDESQLQEELSKLVQAELVFQKGHPPRCSYVFKHALLKDALYDSLSDRKRRQFHKRIA
jgi:predicted ATPase